MLEQLALQSKRIAPSGYRRFAGSGMTWVRVVAAREGALQGARLLARGAGIQHGVTSGGLVAHNCFPKDVSALKMLAGNTGYHFQLLTAVIEVNELQKRRVVGKLEKHLGSLIGKRVALLGLAFKPDTDDMREASSLVLAARLQGEGAEVVAYDPVAAERAAELLGSVEMANSAMEALEGADAAVLVTEWGEFAELDWAAAAERMARPLIVDGRNYLDPEALAAAGFEYEGIGQTVSSARPRPARQRLPPVRSARMQAIVLVGGEGTRLRPLTSDVPKPAVTLVDRPFLAYAIEWLAAHGVTEVVLACGFLPDVLREALGDEEERAGVEITYVAEPEPLGTAGAIRFAADALGERLEERFLALNGDVLADLDLSAPAARPRGARRPGDDRAAPGRGLLRLRAGPLRRGGRGARVPREDRRGGAGRDQRRRLRARALGPRPGARRPARSRSSARSSRGWSATASAGCCSTATGWTSAPPSATCRRAGTSSRAGWRRGCEPTAPGLLVAADAEIDEEAERRPARRRLRRLPGRAPAPRSSDSVLLDGCTVGRDALRARARSSLPGPRWSPVRQLVNAVDRPR